jgi:hypothetical protein
MIASLLAFVLSAFSIGFKKSKAVTVLFALFIWVLFGWNYSNGDYEGYEEKYNTSFLLLLNTSYEIGFNLLCVGSNLIGLSFPQFLIIISGITLLLLLRFILRYSIYPALVIVLFFWVFFPLDYVLLRNFLAFSIVLQGLICVIDDVDYKYVKFIFLILLASTIHSSSFIYLILLLAFYFKTQIKFLYVVLLVLLGIVFYKIIGQAILANVLNVSGGRGDYYQTNLITFISLLILQLVGTIFIIYLYFLLKIESLSTSLARFYLIFLNINVVIFLITVLYFDYSIFIRLYRNIAIVNCVFITNIIFIIYPKNIIGRLKVFFFFLCYLILFFNYFITPYIEDTLLSLFKYNRLL